MFRVFRNPFRYAVAGYGVFNWVKGGVIKKTVGCKAWMILGVNVQVLANFA